MNRRVFLRQAGLVGGSIALVPAFGLAATPGPASGKPSEGLVAFRIGVEQWSPDERFEAMLAFFRKHRGTADELALFTSSTHPPLPLAEIQRRAERLAQRLPRIRQEGMRAGINHLATMGHHEENLAGSLAEPWQRVVDPHGRESRGSFCPAGQPFRAYVGQVYTALAQAGPDFLWIDDDVRLAGHMPIGYTCFCAPCLERFSQETGRQFTRESLLAIFGSGSLEERLRWRRRWLEHNRATINELFQLIEQTVHHVQPKLSLGFMTGDRFYEGYDFGRWVRTLAGSRGTRGSASLPSANPVAVCWRPGGGFYSDEALIGLIGKAHDIGRQVAQLPPEVTTIQSEIENFPYQLLRKSAQTTVVEAATDMGAGTTGTAFNVLGSGPLDEHEPILRRIHQVRPFYQKLRTELGREALVGVWPAWNQDVFAANSADGPWPEGPSDAVGGMGQAYVLGEIGIPLCYGASGARVTALSGPALLAFSREELQRIFSGGVLMDVAAWQTLNRLGLAAWTGVKIGPPRPRDAIEVLANHPLNGRFAGWSRDCRQSFWHETAYSIEASGANVETLARLVDYQGHDLGISMTAFPNEFGGRVVVMGYFPWSQIHNLAKSSQMKRVCAWLSRGQLPVWMESFARVHLWVRAPQPGPLAGVLLNASLDLATGLRLRCARQYRHFTWIDLDGNSQLVKSIARPATGPAELQLPDLQPWGVALLTAQD